VEVNAQTKTDTVDPGVATAAGATTRVGTTAPLMAEAPPKTRPLVLVDFSSPTVNLQATTAQWSTGLSGGTYVYPWVDSKDPSTSIKYPLSQDFADGHWHIMGTVGSFSGFGLWLTGCLADLAAYRGISFKISGNVGPTAGVTLCVGTPATTKPYGSSTCPTSTATCIDGTTEATKCMCAKTRIGVWPSGSEVTVFWTDLRGGYPENSPNPAKIGTISWGLDWDKRYTAAQNYRGDFTVDDIALVP
jgi:hypothetical protein